MALNFLLKRSGTASKRPNPGSMSLGEVDINYNASTGGLFYKDSAGSVVKVGPAEVGASAPNSTPAGSAGNSIGEFWYDTTNNILKTWNGTTWVSGPWSVAAGSVSLSSPATVQLESTDIFVPALESVKGTWVAKKSNGSLFFSVNPDDDTVSVIGDSQGNTVPYNVNVIYPYDLRNLSYDSGGYLKAITIFGDQRVIFQNYTSTDVPVIQSTIDDEFGNTSPFPLNFYIGELQLDGDPGTAGYVLTSNGSGASPTWSTVTLPAATPTTPGAVVGLTTYYNTALGLNALNNIGTGTGNTAIGSGSLFYNTAGSNNVAIGQGSLQYNTGGCNVSIGIAAGSGYVGSCSVLLGYNVQTVTSDDSQLAIGYDFNKKWLTGDSTLAIRPGAGIIDCAGSCGTAGQVLSSTGANAIAWQSVAAPSSFSSNKPVTNGTPVPLLSWSGANRMGTLTAMAYASGDTRAWANMIIASSDPAGVGDSSVVSELNGSLGTFTVEAGTGGTTEVHFNPTATDASVDFQFVYTASFGGLPTIL